MVSLFPSLSVSTHPTKTIPAFVSFVFRYAMYTPHFFRGEQSTAGFHIGDAIPDLPLSPNISSKSSSILTIVNSSPFHLQFAGLANAGMATLEMAAAQVMGARSGQIENWTDSGMAVSSPTTDISTDIDTNNMVGGDQQRGITGMDSSIMSKERTGDQRTLRRLAQNREAARKSRLRKKAYILQLETSRIKLMQLEQELERARQQGIFIASGSASEHGYSIGGNGALAFDVEYARWLDEHQCHITDLRSALNSQIGDDDLHVLVDAVMMHYDEVFRLKSMGTKSDVFHILSGMWTSPAERFFMWLGGFRSSELLKVLVSQLEPLTDQQLMGICNLQQSSQQAEDALSQGMEALLQFLSDTLTSASLGPFANCDNVANHMGHMAIAMGKLGTLENFLHQADLLRQQTLQQMHRILTTRQAARALLVINDYFARLKALSSLWLARPRDSYQARPRDS